MNSELHNLIIRAEVLSEKNWILAVNLLESAIEKYPEEEKVYLSLGDICSKKLQFDKAITAYQKALSLNPSDNHLKYIIGNCYFALNEYRLALSYYDQIDDRTAEVQYNKALTLAYIGKHRESIETIKSNLYYSNSNPFIYFLLIEQLIRLNEHDEALKYLYESESKVGKHKHLTLLGALIYCKKGVWLRAYNLFTEYENISVFTNSDYIHAFGTSAWKIGQFQKAIQLFEKAIETNPYASIYYEDLLRVYLHENEIEKARLVLENAHKKIIRFTPVLSLLRERIEAMTNHCSED